MRTCLWIYYIYTCSLYCACNQIAICCIDWHDLLKWFVFANSQNAFRDIKTAIVPEPLMIYKSNLSIDHTTCMGNTEWGTKVPSWSIGAMFAEHDWHEMLRWMPQEGYIFMADSFLRMKFERKSFYSIMSQIFSEWNLQLIIHANKVESCHFACLSFAIPRSTHVCLCSAQLQWTAIA